MEFTPLHGLVMSGILYRFDTKLVLQQPELQALKSRCSSQVASKVHKG